MCAERIEECSHEQALQHTRSNHHHHHHCYHPLPQAAVLPQPWKDCLARLRDLATGRERGRCYRVWILTVAVW